MKLFLRGPLGNTENTSLGFGVVMNAKKAAKAVLASVLFQTKLIPLLQHFRLKDKITILLYHRVVDGTSRLPDYSPDGMTVTKREFEQQMAYLKARYRLMSLADFVSYRLQGRRPPPGTCIVTFDDGWASVYQNAFPILIKYHIPATVFIAPAQIENRKWFWEERLRFLIAGILADPHKNAADREALTALLAEEGFKGDNNRLLPGELALLLDRLVVYFRTRPQAMRRGFIAALEAIGRAGTRAPVNPFMNWDQVREMAAHGVGFGSHSLTHRNLLTCDIATAHTEIHVSKRQIETQLQKAVTLFAFPYGKQNEEIRRLVQDAGYRAAALTVRGHNDVHADLFALKRINIHSQVAATVPFYACRILKLFDKY